MVAFGVCGFALLVGALASQFGTTFEQTEIPAQGFAEGETQSGSSSSLKNFFALGSPLEAKMSPKGPPNSRPTSGPQTESTKSELAVAWKQSTARLKYLDQCVESQSCAGFSQETPSSYYLETRLAQAEELRAFTRIAVEWKTQTAAQDLPIEAKKIAEHFLETGDDDVKEAALDLVNQGEPSDKTLNAVMKALMRSGDGRLMEQAMSGYLKNHVGDAKLDRFLLYQIAKNTTRVASATVKNMQPYLTADNTGPIEIVSSKVFDTRSIEHAYVKANVAESKRIEEGG